jgi:hypothetical protein
MKPKTVTAGQVSTRVCYVAVRRLRRPSALEKALELGIWQRFAPIEMSVHLYSRSSSA